MDLTLPPRLDDEPGSARLASQPDDRSERLEEVIVVSDGWRLPDLGSEWRANEEAESEPGRIEVSFLPLFDPENRDPYANLFPRHGEIERVGFIELFRIRFGGRPPRD